MEYYFNYKIPNLLFSLLNVRRTKQKIYLEATKYCQGKRNN